MQSPSSVNECNVHCVLLCSLLQAPPQFQSKEVVIECRICSRHYESVRLAVSHVLHDEKHKKRYKVCSGCVVCGVCHVYVHVVCGVCACGVLSLCMHVVCGIWCVVCVCACGVWYMHACGVFSVCMHVVYLVHACMWCVSCVHAYGVCACMWCVVCGVCMCMWCVYMQVVCGVCTCMWCVCACGVWEQCP